MNYWRSEVQHVAAGAVTLRGPGHEDIEIRVRTGELRAGEAVTVGIRPEHVADGRPESGGTRGRIELIEQLGDSHLLYVRTGERSLFTVRAPGDTRHGINDEVSLVLPRERCHVFDRSGRALAH